MKVVLQRAREMMVVMDVVLRVTSLHAQDNAWISATGGAWQTPGNWSAGAPSSNQATLFITNAATKTVTIDAATAAGYPGTLTVGNLTLSGSTVTTNTLWLNSAGTTTPLRVLGNFTAAEGGALRLTNSALYVGADSGGAFVMDGAAALSRGVLRTSNVTAWVGLNRSGFLSAANSSWQGNTVMLGRYAGSTGTVSLTASQLDTYSAYVGYEGAGVLSLSNTAWQNDFAYVGFMGDSEGTVNLAGGTNLVNYDLYLGLTPGSSGSIMLASGRLTITNGWTHVGDVGAGELTVNGGLCESAYLTAGNMAGSHGTLTIAGGTSTVTAVLCAGFYAGATGIVSVTGGQLNVINNVAIGNKGLGTFTVSGGVFNGPGMTLGYDAGSSGTLTVTGGTANVQYLRLGQWAGSTGTVLVTGGELLTAPGESTSIGFGGVGSMTVSGGTWESGGLDVGYGSRGTLTIAGGASTVGYMMRIGESATGTVLVTGGSLTVTNDSTYLGGGAGTGRMTVSNGTWRAKEVFVVANSALTLAGGTHDILGGLTSGYYPGTTGTVLLAGGHLNTARTGLGFSGCGEMMVSGGVWQAGDVAVGGGSSGRGSLSIAGGTNTISSSLFVGGGRQDSLSLNAGRLITTNATTYVYFTGLMNVSNGTWMARDVTVGGYQGGALTLAGGESTLTGPLSIGASGTVWLVGGSLTVTDAATTIDGIDSRFVNSNRLWTAGETDVGAYAGSRGNLIAVGGTNLFLGPLTVGHFAGATGAVLATGGQLVTTNLTLISNAGVGSMTVSGAVWQAQEVSLGYNSGGRGTLTLLDGTTLLGNALSIADGNNTAGDVLFSGGQLTVTNSATYVGSYGRGSLTLSNGLFQGWMLYAGMANGSSGTLALDGGTNVFSSHLYAGYNAGATGTMVISGGLLVATNAGSSQLVVGRAGWGSYLQSGGTVILDRLLATNGARSVVVLHAGTLSVADGAISNGSVFSIGDGTHPAALAVRSGTLSNANGAVIHNLATLCGSGTVTGDMTVEPGGSVSPGGSIGTLTLLGSLTLSPQSLLRFEAGAPGIHDRLNVIGSLGIGGLLEIVDVGGLTTGAYTLFTCTGSLTTNSLIRVRPLGGGLTGIIDYGSGSNLTLIVAAGLEPYVAYASYYFGTTNTFGAKTADADADGLSNEQEMLAGTDPADPLSVMRLLNLRRAGDDSVITWQTSGGDPLFAVAPKTNAVQYSDTMDGDFTNRLATVVLDRFGDQCTNVTDATEPAAPFRFYRVLMAP